MSGGGALLALEYYDRGALPGYDRLQTNSNLRGFGGQNFDVQTCNPGTLSVGGKAYAIPPGQNGIGLSPGSLVAGTVNLCNNSRNYDIVPQQKRWSVFSTIHQQVLDNVELFAEASFSDRTSHSTSSNFTTLSVPETNAFYVGPSGGGGGGRRAIRPDR
jgi:iron complex outermembrane recepter protein